jgi:hypothetical protein
MRMRTAVGEGRESHAKVAKEDIKRFGCSFRVFRETFASFAYGCWSPNP